jgi:hypothetical protein
MGKFEQSLLACLLTPLEDPNDPLCPWGIVPNYIGAPGTGKSKRIRTVVSWTGMNCYPIYAATKTPEHIGGFPANTSEGFMLRCALPQVLHAVDDQVAVIYLDEISTAPPAVQAALLSFVNERTVGEYVLPVGVRIVMAMNPADIAANGHDLEVPMANRVAHFQYDPPTPREWCDYIMKRNQPNVEGIRVGEDRVKQNWPFEWPNVAALAEDFMMANNSQFIVKDADGKEHRRSKLFDQPDSDDPRAAGAWPSHRTWEWAIHGVCAVRCLGFDPSLETDIVEALVGKGLAVEWANYARKFDLPKPHDVLTKGWTIPKRIDIARVVFNSCAAHVADIKDKKEQAAKAVACWNLLNDAIVNSGFADITVQPTQQLVSANLDTTHDDPDVADVAEEVCSTLYDSKLLKYYKGPS